MVSKNNYRLMTERCFSHQQHWGLRKLSIGVASVLLGTAIIAQGSVYADTQTTPSDSSENSVDKTVDNPTDSGQTYVLKSSANSAASDNSGTPTSSTDNATSASTPNESAANEDTDINGVPTTFTCAKSAVTSNGDSNPNTKESGEYWPDTKGASIKNYDKTTSTDFSTDKAASENHAIDPSTIKGYDQEYSDTPNLMHTQDLHLYVNGKEVDISTLQDDDKLNDNSEYPNHNSKGHARLIKVSDFGPNTYFYARNAVQKYNQITGEIDHYDVKWTLESVNYANEQALLAFGIKGILDGGGNLLFNVGSGWQVAKRGNFANTHLQFFKEINVHKFANQDGTLKETVTEAIKNGDIVATALKIHEGFTDLDNNEAIEISENAVHRVLVDDSATLAYQKTNDGYLAITRTYNDISDHDAKFNNANQVVALLELDVPKEGFDLSIATSGPSTKGEMAEGSKVAPAVLDTVAYLKTLTVNYYELGENGNPTTIKLKDTKTAHNFIGKSYGLQNTDQDQDGKQDAFDYSAPQEITDQDGTTWRLVKQTGNNLKNHTYQDCLNVINYYYQKSEVRRQGTESVTYKFYNDQEKTELVKEITKTPVCQDGKWQWQVKETDYDDQGNETHQSITTDGLIEGLSADQATVKFTGTVNYDSNGKASGTTWDANNSTYGTIKTPAIEGYTADKPSVGGETVSPNDSSLNREYKVVYTQNRYHKGKDTETKDVTRTIEYYDNVTHEPIPSNLESTVTQTATLKRNKIYDDQNNFIGYGTVSADGSSYTIDNSWKVDAQTWTQQDSTDLSDYGYTAPDRASVATVTVDGSTTNVTEKVYYGHQTMPVTPTNPGTPGKPINPKGDAKYPKGITKNDLTATVKRTINYVDENGNKVNGAPDGTSTYVQTAEFTRTAIVDKVTGKILGYDTNNDGKVDTENANRAWTPIEKTLETVKSADPSSVGYDKVDIANVSSLVVTPDQGNKTVKVTYSNNKTYHMGTDAETKDVTRTIEYYDSVTHEPIPSNLESTVTQTATLKRNKIYDDQNNFIGYGTVSADGSSYTIDNSWKVDAQTWTQQDSTDLSDYGYTAPDRASVATVTVDGSTTNVTEKVYYGHQTMPVTPTNPGTPGKPINPKGDAKYPKGITKNDLTATVKRTINYVDEDGNKVNGAPDGTSSYVQTAEFTRTAIVDKVTGKILGYDTNNDGKVDTESADRAWTPIEKTLEAVKSADPSSVGYDNVDIANVSSLVVTPDQGNKTVKVTYNNNPVSGTIKYIDDTTGVELDSDNLPSGKIGSTINYKTADKIKSYKDQGYELVSNDFTDGSQVYKKTGNDFVVRLKHKTQTITPNDPNPVTPGQPINPNNPNSPVYPTGVDHKNLAKDATQTIHYIGAGDKTPADNIVRQKDAFTRTVTIDKVTGKILTITPWSTKTFNTVNTPVVNGYHADKKVAGGLTATVDNPNVEDTVNYAPNGKLIPVDPNGKPIPGADTPTYTTDPKNPTKVLNPTVPSIDGWEPKDKRPGDSITPKDPGRDTPVPYDQVVSGTIKYIDDTTGKELSSENLAKGTVGSKISYTTKDKIKDYEGHGYELVSNNFTDGTQTYAKEGNDFVVHLKHAIKESVSYKDATQTIHYTGVGSDTLTDKVQTEKNAFSKTDTVDKVTGEVTKTTGWVGTKTFGTEDTPVVNGYHADKKVAGGLTATVDNPNVEETVTYAPNGKLIPVDENGTPIPGANTPTYTTDSNDPTKVLNPTVPRIDGWQPKDNQPGDSITPNDPGKDTKVPYVQVVSGTIKYIDDTTGKELSGENLKKGTVGSKIDYQTADKIKDYENQGYELVSNDFTDGTQTYAKEGNDFIVHLKHATKTITPEDPATPGDPINPNDPNSPVYPTEVDHKNLAKDATQTIHYIGAGDKTPADNIVRQKDAFTRTVTIDKVTGKILTITPWSTKTFNTVNTPVVNGYHADKKTAGGLTATVDNPNVEETVTYAPNGKLIPVDENGKPIPGANTPTYTTDSNDPTKVLSPTVPRIDGWQPKDNQPGDSITPKDPGKDTPVIYVEKPQKPVMPVVPEQPENPAVPNNSEQPRTPDQPDNSKQPSKPTITDQPNDSIVPNNAKHLAALTPRDQSQGISAVPGDSKQRATVSNSVAAVSEKETTLPQTGNDKNQAEAAMGLGLTSLSTIMAMLGLKKRRHN